MPSDLADCYQGQGPQSCPPSSYNMYHFFPFSTYSSTLKMEAAGSFSILLTIYESHRVISHKAVILTMTTSYLSLFYRKEFKLKLSHLALKQCHGSFCTEQLTITVQSIKHMKYFRKLVFQKTSPLSNPAVLKLFWFATHYKT
jgi:hypothetical protein